MNLKTFMVCAMMGSVSLSALAQSQTVKGIVRDETGEPLPKAVVSIKESKGIVTAGDDGTFQNKQDARKYWMQETRYVPMGGETAKLSTYCSVDNAAKQMANYHWSYINKDYHLDVIKKWREEDLYNKMERLIGYRFSLTEGHYPTAAQAGEPYALTLKLHNDGWAATTLASALPMPLLRSALALNTTSVSPTMECGTQRRASTSSAPSTL